MIGSTLRCRVQNIVYSNRQVVNSCRFLSTKPGNLKLEILDKYSTIDDSPINIKLPKWQKFLGTGVVRLFGLDMDRIRSGPIAGGYFRDLCEDQAKFSKNGPLTERSKFYYETLKMPQTFNQWYQITILHVWMLFVRMRSLPRAYCREYQQKLVNRIFDDIDFQLRETIKIYSDRRVNMYKKDMSNQLRGSVFAYDEGFVSDDTVLAGAVWRNMFEGRTDVDISEIEQIVHYIRAQLYALDKISDKDFTQGRFSFIDPSKRYEPLTQSEEKDLLEQLEQKRSTLEDSPATHTGFA